MMGAASVVVVVFLSCRTSKATTNSTTILQHLATTFRGGGASVPDAVVVRGYRCWSPRVVGRPFQNHPLTLYNTRLFLPRCDDEIQKSRLLVCAVLSLRSRGSLKRKRETFACIQKGFVLSKTTPSLYTTRAALSPSICDDEIQKSRRLSCGVLSTV